MPAQTGAEPLPQACAIPFRRTAEGTLEFCLITSAGKGRWGFPKGAIETGETQTETALKEAFEEAGLQGRIVGPCIGRYGYRKWDRDLVVACFLMEVVEAHDEWLESGLRMRRWVATDDVSPMLGRPEQRVIFDIALEYLAALEAGAS